MNFQVYVQSLLESIGRQLRRDRFPELTQCALEKAEADYVSRHSECRLNDIEIGYLNADKTRYVEGVAMPIIHGVPKADDRYPHKCPSCGAAAYIGLTSVDCTVCK
jgi:hypothetical protein